MLRLRTFRITAALILLLLGVSAPSPARAGFVYQVSADTSSLNGQSGFIDLQFNPGGSAESATASVTGFQTTGTAAVLAASVVDTGDASGALPGTLTFDNGTGFNDIFQGITFGTGLSFQVTFSGPAVVTPGGTSGSSFALSFYAADGFTPLLTTDTNGSVVTLNLNVDGTISSMTFGQSPTNNTPAASSTPAVTPAPEPSSLALLVSALPAGLTVVFHLRRRVQPST